jgi:uncharacterized protein YegP (UPF0339 family)
MSAESNGGVLYNLYRKRIGEPTTHDEVRGYWVFLTGVVLGTLGLLLFIPSTSAVGASGLTLREASIFLAAIGLVMLVAGSAIRLPLQPWANYAAYVGQAVCFVAAVWFLLVFPGNWNVQTGNQPVIVLYVLGLALITVGGLVVPLFVGVTREDLAASERRVADLEAELADTRRERDRLESEVADARRERDQLESELEETRAAGETARTDLQATLDALQTSQSRFELYEDRSEQWRWRLRHRNGNVIANGGEGYTRRHNAQNGIQAVRRDALGATVMLVEAADALPPEDEAFEPVEETPSRAEFELYEDESGKFRWRLRHDNGNVIADGGEGYASRGGAENAIDGIREYVGPADYLRADPTAIEIYRDEASEFRWRLVHENGNILADSGEGYSNRSNARRAVDRIRDRIDDMEFEVYEDGGGEFRWRLRGGNEEIMADGGEGYESRDGAEEAVDRVRNYLPDADTLDVGSAAFEVYEDRAGKFRWRLRHRNGNILADSGQGYADRSGSFDGIESVKRNAPTAEIETAAG